MLERLLADLRSQGTLLDSSSLTLDLRQAQRLGGGPRALSYPLWFVAAACRAGATTVELRRTERECSLAHDGAELEPAALEGAPGCEELRCTLALASSAQVVVESGAWGARSRPEGGWSLGVSSRTRGVRVTLSGLPWQPPGEAFLLATRARFGPLRLVLNQRVLGSTPGPRRVLARRLLRCPRDPWFPPRGGTEGGDPWSPPPAPAAIWSDERTSPGEFSALLEIAAGPCDWMVVDRGVSFPLGRGPGAVRARVYCDGLRGAPWPDALVITQGLREVLARVQEEADQLEREIGRRLVVRLRSAAIQT